MRLVLTLLLLCLLPASVQAAPLRVVASFSVLGDMVRQVGGDDVALTTLIGPDSDSHAYAPSPADAATLAHADLVVINGMGFEGWMERLIASSGYKGTVLVASDGIAPLMKGPHPDPHAWQDVANGKRYITNIRDGLSRADPLHKVQYYQRAADMLARLDKLDAHIRTQVGSIAPDRRKVITTHEAFGYYARAYGITFVAPLSSSKEMQASAAAVARLIDRLRTQHIRAVFMENISDNRLMQQLKADSDTYIGGTLYSDALSQAGGEAPDYIALLSHNTQQLVNGMRHNR